MTPCLMFTYELCIGIPSKEYSMEKGKKTNFPTEKPEKHCLNINSNESCWQHAYLIWDNEIGTSLLWFFSKKENHNFNPIIKITSDKCQLEYNQQNAWTALLQIIKSFKITECLRNCLSQRILKDLMSEHNVVSEWTPGAEKRAWGKNQKTPE